MPGHCIVDQRPQPTLFQGIERYLKRGSLRTRLIPNKIITRPELEKIIVQAVLTVVGVDIAKQTFDSRIQGTDLSETFQNDKAGFKKFVKWLKKHTLKTARVCMEATGLLWEPLAEFLFALNFEVVVVNPRRIKGYAVSEVELHKDDPIDARLIADFCAEKYKKLQLWKPLSPERKAIRTLLRRRTALMADLTAERIRLKAGFTDADAIASIKRHIDWLRSEICRLEKQLKTLLPRDSELAAAAKLVDSIKGFGWLGAITLVAELPQCLWDDERAATAFAGLVPAKLKSGTSLNRTVLSRAGNRYLRTALFMPALSAKRTNPVCRAFYDRLLARGKTHKQALTAVMRKMLQLAIGVLRTKKKFDVNHSNKAA